MSVSNRELIEILDAFGNTDKSVICKNLDLLFSARYKFRNQTGSRRIAILSGITQSSTNTVMAWRNLGRVNPKIPFIKLLQIAEAFDIPYEYLLRVDDAWFDEATSAKLEKKIIEMEGVYGND